MAITYTWTIRNLERNLSDGGVTKAHWRCEGVDGDYSQSLYGICDLTYDASASDFIAYDDLTETNVIGWVRSIVDETDIQTSIASKIEEDKTPTMADGVPW